MEKIQPKRKEKSFSPHSNFAVTSFFYFVFLFALFFSSVFFFMTSGTNYQHLIPSFRHVAITSSGENAPCK